MEKETIRIENFSDAVFAISITLLVLDLHAPDTNAVKNNTELLIYLKGEWTSYLAFTLSFFSIFIMWVNHHKIFKQIYSRNTAIMFANGLILFLVAAVSYPTALLARFFDGEASNIAAAIYTGIFVLINISYNLLWFIASNNKKLLRPGITNSAIRKIRNNYLYGLPTYLIAFGISFQFPAIALTISMILLLFWAVSSGKINIAQE
ncbi:TMEM175 family protein [Flavobacterium sp. ZS1P14]|uniref:TMEM175 family protein n=1 Tax=Flavobacterium sp. ZS1P14 TaxID=3401729 RepID=UPI003AAB316E